jgi:hypothetical protein
MSTKHIFEAQLTVRGLQNDSFLIEFKHSVLPLFEEMANEQLDWDRISAIFKNAEKISGEDFNSKAKQTVKTASSKIQLAMQNMYTKLKNTTLASTDIKHFEHKVLAIFSENSYSKDAISYVKKLASYGESDKSLSKVVVSIFATVLSIVKSDTPENNAMQILKSGSASINKNKNSRIDPTISSIQNESLKYILGDDE